MTDRSYDIALFGATGFAGGLTADYLAENLPEGARLALVGRNRKKLEKVRDRIAGINPAMEQVGLLEADSTDPESLARVAASTKVVITTVGPYLEYGEPLVAACAKAGTDYVDLTGEPEFIDRMYLEHHEAAHSSGARIVHACGFDSIPHDLGAMFTVKQLPEQVPLSIRGIVRTNGSLSGGTLHSALGQMSRLGDMSRTRKKRAEIEPRPAGRKVRTTMGKTHRDRVTDNWLIPLPTVDPDVVKHSAAARADYGPDFTYSHFAGAKKLRTVIASVIGFPLFVLAVQIPPLRGAIGKRVARGDGPTQERRDRTWFTVDFIGTGGGETVHTRVTGGDPGYTETAKMLAESAMSLAFDENPTTSGQVTSATAMGENLLDRLQTAGIDFTVMTDE